MSDDRDAQTQTQTRVLGETQAEAAGGGIGEPDDSTILSPGSRLDRYIVGKCIGSGGMGVVLEAHDPKLDRKVALKVLHSWGSRAETTEGRARLVREAQAMAKLSHPHVVPVFDVGEQDGRVFVAMELVDGVTLGAWLRTQSPSAERIFAVLMQAAAGLSAAHEAGFAHRDFKPSNVMVTPEDRAMVMDFGLARVVDPEASVERSIEPESSASQAVVDAMATLTKDGTVMGTPAYMAPEQHTGDKPDHRADQFAFCATVWEALQGERAFTGETVGELAHRKVHDGPQAVAERPIPRAVAAVLRRGMAPHPDDRHASMEHLIRALRRARRPRRRGSAVIMVGLIAMSVGGWWLTRGPEAQQCDAGRERMGALWNDERRSSLAASFLGTPVSFARDVWRSTSERVDAYADEWKQAHRSACEASGSGQRLDRAMACLSRAESALAATLDRLAAVDSTSIRHAVQEVSGLPPIGRCRDEGTVGIEFSVPTDPARAESIAAVRATLDATSAGLLAGRTEQVRPAMEDAVERARALEFAPLTAEALLTMGRVEFELAEYESAEARLLEAVSVAEGAGANEIAAKAAIGLLRVNIGGEIDLDAADEWGRHARAWIERGALGVRVQAQLESALGSLAMRKERDDRAEAHYRRSHELLLAKLDEQHPELIHSLLNIAYVLGQRGQGRESLSYSQQALELAERVFGSRHPEVADALHEVGASYAILGDMQASEQAFARALSITEEVYGPMDMKVVSILNATSEFMRMRGQYVEARPHLERALAIYEAKLGEHPDTGMVWARLGAVAFNLEQDEESLRCYDRAIANARSVYDDDHLLVVRLRSARAVTLARLGRHDEAREAAEAAVATTLAVAGPDDMTTMMTIRSLGWVLFEVGDYEGALARHREALTRIEALLGPHDHETASAHYDIAEIEVKLRRHDTALEQLVLVRESLGDPSTSPDFWAMVDFLEAQARWERGDDRASARRLAEQAEAFFAESPHNYASELREVRQWLAGHRLDG